jgi:hypothetical protein
MIATTAVLAAAVPVYDELTESYRRVKELTGALSGARPSPWPAQLSAVQRSLNAKVENAIRVMRHAMRADLGVLDNDNTISS